MVKSLLTGLFLAACAPLALRNSAEAQLGSIIKKKVTEAIKLQDEFRQVLAKYPTPQEYEACKAQAAQTLPLGLVIMPRATER